MPTACRQSLKKKYPARPPRRDGKVADQIRLRLIDLFGKVTSKEEFARQSYFCSALVVACYTISGVIEGSAEAAYPPDVFSPADLYRDPTFGWFLGYLARDADSIPADDPLMAMTLWRDHQDMRWWSRRSKGREPHISLYRRRRW